MEVAELEDFEREIVALEQSLAESTDGRWVSFANPFESHDDAAAFFRGAISQHESATLYGVGTTLADGTPKIIAITGNSPHAQVNAKLLMVLHEFAPQLVQMLRGLIDLEKPGNVTFEQVADATEVIRGLMTRQEVVNVIVDVLDAAERDQFEQAAGVLQRLPGRESKG